MEIRSLDLNLLSLKDMQDAIMTVFQVLQCPRILASAFKRWERLSMMPERRVEKAWPGHWTMPGPA